MLVQVMQTYGNVWLDTTMDKILEHIGTMQPLQVGTEQEFDYLWAMQLMIGREFVILLDGRDENPTDLPPSIIRFML